MTPTRAAANPSVLTLVPAALNSQEGAQGMVSGDVGHGTDAVVEGESFEAFLKREAGSVAGGLDPSRKPLPGDPAARTPSDMAKNGFVVAGNRPALPELAEPGVPSSHEMSFSEPSGELESLLRQLHGAVLDPGYSAPVLEDAASLETVELQTWPEPTNIVPSALMLAHGGVGVLPLQVPSDGSQTIPDPNVAQAVIQGRSEAIVPAIAAGGVPVRLANLTGPETAIRDVHVLSVLQETHRLARPAWEFRHVSTSNSLSVDGQGMSGAGGTLDPAIPSDAVGLTTHLDSELAQRLPTRPLNGRNEATGNGSVTKDWSRLSATDRLWSGAVSEPKPATEPGASMLAPALPALAVHPAESPSAADQISVSISAFLQQSISAQGTGATAETGRGGEGDFSAQLAPDLSVVHHLKVLTIALQPQGLGQVNVKLRLEGQRLGVIVSAESESAARLIDGQLKSLSDALIASGYELDGVVVRHAAETIDARNDASVSNESVQGQGADNFQGRSHDGSRSMQEQSYSRQTESLRNRQRMDNRDTIEISSEDPALSVRHGRYV